ncbi:DUF4476 domain-containing protein [Flaviaesturariibacter flavus]|uniref:DUF4476 domain-containing protein n=1 Tax=Flaviaesturariibacter flavus TaxID=2502780 RepID=A0A4R1BMG8_9BACT|nr:DUF4476 domain-containing protein [Flaviaesturariibacter flavus]TCJ18643.1 DUF4476 domain-containing protein [Flaviaesturariibacter flavus]
MRTIFTLLLGLVLSVAVHAADQGRLTITFSGLTDLYVQIDNRYFSATDNLVCVDGIPAGKHTVKVFQPRNGSNVNGRLLYQGQVMIRPDYHVDITFNRFGKAFFDEKRYGGMMYSDYDTWGNAACGTTGGWSQGGGWNNGNGGWNNGNGNGNTGWNGAVQAMAASDFSALVAQLRAERFDNTKLTLAKDALAYNRVSAAQVKQLMQLFTFDSDRLEMAKAAYPRTVDKNNYFQVMDAFEFSNSKEQLSAWIRTQN